MTTIGITAEETLLDRHGNKLNKRSHTEVSSLAKIAPQQCGEIAGSQNPRFNRRCRISKEDDKLVNMLGDVVKQFILK